MAKIYHNLVSVDEVIPIIEKYMDLRPRETFYVNLSNALGMVLAEDVIAPNDAPPFDRSEVDGYAVVSKSVVGAEEDRPIRLKIKGVSKIGEVPRHEVKAGEAIEIDTGAIIPRGADAVIMVEYTKRLDNEVLVFKAVAPGENIAFTGSDIVKGEIILKEGTVLTARELALLAAIGIDKVKVYKPPNVGVISIGREIIDPGKELKLGKIYDVNSYALYGSLKEMNLNVTRYGIVTDDYESIKNVLLRALTENDIIITSGGTSAGIDDLTYRVVDSLGSPGIVIHGLKIKPGKPTFFAIIGDKLVVGLPGFPLSALMIHTLLVKQILYKMMGYKDHELNKLAVKAELTTRILGASGRETLVPVALISTLRGLKAFPIFTKSGSISPMVYADGFIRISEDRGYVDQGEKVNVYLFSQFIKIADMVIIGSHDYGLERIINLMEPRPNVKLINAGSLAGLIAVARGEADIGGIHLLDEQTMTYNISYFRKLGLEGKAILVRGYRRNVGLIIDKGNPKNIKGIQDLLRNDIVFINRNKGSGTRVFLDFKLKQLATKLGISFQELTNKIRGYTLEVSTHTAVAAAVNQGRADVGIGIEMAAHLYGLDFIKLWEEQFDFVVNKDSLNKRSVSAFIKILKSSEIKECIERNLRGYKVPADIGNIIYSG